MSTTSTGSSSRRRRRERDDRRSDVQAELRQLGIRPRRSWGQSFLIDEFVADSEAALVEAPRHAPIIEVGGGLGILTGALLRRGFDHLTVVEQDRRLAIHLRRKFGRRVEVVEGDALREDWHEPRALVGNLPFSVATPLLIRGFEDGVPEIVAVVQREVAERIVGRPGSRSYGRLSILTSLYGSAELFQVVPEKSFEPTPKVEGRLVRFQRRPGAVPVPSVPEFARMVSYLFARRRKQLKNTLPGLLKPPRDAGMAAAASGWPSDWGARRPEELAPEMYFALARTVGEYQE